LFAKLSKCEFLKDEVTFCGHIINELGIRLSEDKVQAIQVKPNIKNIKDLQSYLGMSVWFQDFVKDYAKITAPLTDLLKQNIPFQWTTKQDNAVEELRMRISHASILRYFDPNLRTVAKLKVKHKWL
jgi:hypothetical protein